MSDQKRADIFAEEEAELELGDFAAGDSAALGKGPAQETLEAVSEAVGFPSREPRKRSGKKDAGEKQWVGDKVANQAGVEGAEELAATPAARRVYRTGRDTQWNLKVKHGTKELALDIVDYQKHVKNEYWPWGRLVEEALAALLEREKLVPEDIRKELVKRGLRQPE